MMISNLSPYPIRQVRMYKLVPDLQLTIEDIISEGDKVVCRNIWRWTDTNSGKKMQFHAFVPLPSAGLGDGASGRGIVTAEARKSAEKRSS